MQTESTVVIVVPAKGTSKRLPSKNLLSLGGKFGAKTMVEVAVDRSIDSGLGLVVVSSDGLGVLRTSRNYSTSDVYYMDRSKSLGGVGARAWEVCLDVVDHFDKLIKMKIDTILMTLPTSPFCIAGDLINALDLFYKNSRRPVLSVTQINFNPETCGVISGSGRFSAYDGTYWEGLKNPSLNNGSPFLSNGAVWVCDVDMLREKRDQYIDGMIAYVMPEERSVDINTQFDYSVARLLASQDYGGLGE